MFQLARQLMGQVRCETEATQAKVIRLVILGCDKCSYRPDVITFSATAPALRYAPASQPVSRSSSSFSYNLILRLMLILIMIMTIITMICLSLTLGIFAYICMYNNYTYIPVPEPPSSSWKDLGNHSKRFYDSQEIPRAA